MTPLQPDEREVALPVLLGGLVLLTALLALLSLAIGKEPVPVVQAIRELVAGADSIYATILVQIRLPRTLIAIIAGATLGLSGAAMQGLLRNPLASPGLVGSASGAALFAVTVLYFGFSAWTPWLVPVVGMAGSLLAMFVVHAIAGANAGVTTLILAGVAVNAFATALISLLLNLSPSPYAVQELVLWTLGDLTDRSLNDVRLMLPATLIGWLLLLGSAPKLDVLTLGERTALTMGVDFLRLRWHVFIGVSLAVGAAVSTTGMIGFIGLVVPHLLRQLVGHQPGRLLIVSMFGGAAMLLAADIGVRLIPSVMPLRVGVLTAMVGAPFFLHLILRSRNAYPG